MGANFYGQPDPQEGTTCGLSPNVAAGLSYLFGFIGGLVFLLLERRNSFIRFAAVQSLILSAVYIVFWIAYGILLGIIAMLPGIRLLLLILLPIRSLLGLGFVILWLFLIIRAFQGIAIRLPIVGDLANRHS